MLPAGPLREPASRLREVDAVVHLVAAPARSDDPRTTYMTQVPGAWRNVRDPARVADVSAWRGTRVHAVAGIGNPGRFFALLRGQGIAAVEHAVADHHAYTRGDFPWPKAMAILMTQKDAVKCASFADERFWYLPVRASIDPALVAVVERKIRGPQAA
jgi:tetraacyldisaccharide 4'-kinase